MWSTQVRYPLSAVLTVGFAETSYSAIEGMGIVFTIQLSDLAEVEVTVEFSTMDDTAEGKWK